MWVEFLLVLSLAPRGFPRSSKTNTSNSNSIWNARTRLKEFTRTPKCFVGNQTTMFNYNGINRISTEEIELFKFRALNVLLQRF